HAAASRLSHEAVVAPPAGDGARRSRPARRDRLVGRARVVVEPAHELRVDEVRDPEAGERFPQPVEVRAAIVAEELLHAGRARRDLLALRVLAVEHADGIRLRPVLAILAEAIG